MALAGQDGSRIDLEGKGESGKVVAQAPPQGAPFIHTVFLGLITLFRFIIVIILAVAAGETAFMMSRAMNVMQALPQSVPRTAQTLMAANIPAFSEASSNFADTLIGTLPATSTAENVGFYNSVIGVATPLKLFAAIVAKTNWVVPSAAGAGINGMVDMPFGEPVTTWILKQMDQADIRNAAGACAQIATNLQGINFDQIKADQIYYEPDGKDGESYKKATTNDFVFEEGYDKVMQTIFSHMSQVCTALQSYSSPV
jgi:hypothetical protein